MTSSKSTLFGPNVHKGPAAEGHKDPSLSSSTEAFQKWPFYLVFCRKTLCGAFAGPQGKHNGKFLTRAEIFGKNNNTGASSLPPLAESAELVLIVLGNFSCNDCMAGGGQLRHGGKKGAKCPISIIHSHPPSQFTPLLSQNRKGSI